MHLSVTVLDAKYSAILLYKFDCCASRSTITPAIQETQMGIHATPPPQMLTLGVAHTFHYVTLGVLVCPHELQPSVTSHGNLKTRIYS
jgi:hypothetical protein